MTEQSSMDNKQYCRVCGLWINPNRFHSTFETSSGTVFGFLSWGSSTEPICQCPVPSPSEEEPRTPIPPGIVAAFPDGFPDECEEEGDA